MSEPFRGRDPDRSRSAILDSAEYLFATNGFRDTSLAEVGARARVSRGTPGYFFGSKEGLYRAVLARCFADALDAVRSGRLRAERSGKPAGEVLAGAVADYVDFVSAHPSFVRLIHREALGDGPGGRTGTDGFAVGAEAVAALAQELGLPDGATDAVRHLVLSLIALTWFPELHRHTLVPSVGLDHADPQFLEQRKRHITTLLTGALPVAAGRTR
jgi:AcrR family transcriptional regulator